MKAGDYQLVLKSIVWLLLFITSSAALAQMTSTSCLDSLQIRGDEKARAITRDILRSADFDRVHGPDCVGAELEVQQTGDVWLYTLRRGSSTVSRSVEEPEAIVPWLESWLMRPTPAPTVSPTLNQTEGPTSPSDWKVPMQLNVRANVDLDDHGPFWPGGEVSFSFGLSRTLWLAVAAAATWSSQGDVDRNTQRFGLRLGQAQKLSWGQWSFGGGGGLAAGHAKQDMGGGQTVSDSVAQVYLEAITSFDVPISRRLGLSTALLLRGYIPDDFDDEQEVPAEPVPLPALSFGLQFGVSWNL